MKHHFYTVEEYLALEESSPVRHEYVGGEIYALAGASERHNRIAGNVHARLWMAARGGLCRVMISDMRLRVSDEAYYYPDIMVVYDPDDNDPLTKRNPCLLVEVLSPTTLQTDRREKLLAYRTIEHLQAYLLIYQDERRVVRHWREEHRSWQQTELVESGEMLLTCPGVTLTLHHIYEGLT